MRVQPAMDLGEAEPVGEPRRDLLLVDHQSVGHRRGPAHRGRANGGDHRHHLLVGRVGIAATESGGHRGRHVLGDRLPVAPGPPRDGAEAFPQAEPAQHLANFDHTQLPIGHDHLLGRG